MQLFKFSIHTSPQHPCTRRSLAVWSPRNFQYTPKQWFSVLLGVKRTSDSSSAPQYCLGSIYSSLAGHLSSHKTSNNRAVRGATFHNVWIALCTEKPRDLRPCINPFRAQNATRIRLISCRGCKNWKHQIEVWWHQGRGWIREQQLSILCKLVKFSNSMWVSTILRG